MHINAARAARAAMHIRRGSLGGLAGHRRIRFQLVTFPGLRGLGPLSAWLTTR